MDPKAIGRRLAADRGLRTGNRSFLFRPASRPKALALLLHGYSASPYEMRELGAFLKGLGFLVYAPRIAGHGAGREDFDKHGAADWLDGAESALAEFFAPGKKLFLFGHSGGGALATLLAARHPGAFRGLVLGAPCFRLADPFAPLTKLALVRAFKPSLDFQIPYPDAPAHWTLRYATGRVAELLRQGESAARAALRLRLPLLLAQAAHEGLVSVRFNQRLFPRIPSADKELYLYDTEEHNVFHHYNPHQAQVFARVKAFLRRL